MVELDRGVEDRCQPLKGLMVGMDRGIKDCRQPLKGLIIIRPGELLLP